MIELTVDGRSTETVIRVGKLYRDTRKLHARRGDFGFGCRVTRELYEDREALKSYLDFKFAQLMPSTRSSAG